MGRFFRFCSKADEIKLKELCYRKYDIQALLHMDAIEFIEFAEFAMEKEKEDELKLQWNAMLPFMGMKLLKYMPFDEYVDKCTGRNIDMRPAAEIIAEIEALQSLGKEEDNGDF